jgi:hypothetical protein
MNGQEVSDQGLETTRQRKSQDLSKRQTDVLRKHGKAADTLSMKWLQHASVRCLLWASSIVLITYHTQVQQGWLRVHRTMNRSTRAWRPGLQAMMMFPWITVPAELDKRREIVIQTRPMTISANSFRRGVLLACLSPSLAHPTLCAIVVFVNLVTTPLRANLTTTATIATTSTFVLWMSKRIRSAATFTLLCRWFGQCRLYPQFDRDVLL